jgi:hypothetical protein
MKKILTLVLMCLFVISFVSAYSGTEVASAFKEGRLHGTPFPFNNNNEELQDFIAADSNGDGVVTGQEICNAHDMQCVYTQRVAYNFNSNQGNIAEIAGPTIGCFGGENYKYYYPGGELENRGFQAKCIKDKELASDLRDGSILFLRSMDDNADSNGDGVVTGKEACESVGQVCAYTQRLARNVKSDDGYLEVGGPIIGCFGADTYEESQSDRLVKCVKDGDLAKIFTDGRMTSTPFPFNDNNEEVNDFIAADKNSDGVVTGEELCNYHDMNCAFTQRTTYNFDFGNGFMEATEPTIGCYGGENYKYYYPGGELENRGVATRCLSKEISENKCVDTDGGKNEFIAGKTYIGEDIHYDSCYGKEVVEYYCSSESESNKEFIKKDTIPCDYGCKNGACIKSDEKPICGNGICEDGEGEVCTIPEVKCKAGESCEVGSTCYIVCPEDCDIPDGIYAKLNEKFKLKIGQPVKITDYKDMKIKFIDVSQVKCSEREVYKTEVTSSSITGNVVSSSSTSVSEVISSQEERAVKVDSGQITKCITGQIIAKLEVTIEEEPTKYVTIQLGEKKEVFGTTLSFLDYYSNYRTGVFLVSRGIIDCPEECICSADGTMDCPIDEECPTGTILCPDGECRNECEPIVIKECKFGCLYGESCLPIGTRVDDKFCDIDRNLNKQLSNDKSCENNFECLSNNCRGNVCKPTCEGCLNENNVCLPISTRTETQYCDSDYSLKNQKSEEMSCNNNYECSTNICVNNKCISPSFIQKIIDWFSKLLLTQILVEHS